nr:putative integron gene cassette protein [uncultured bacterium]
MPEPGRGWIRGALVRTPRAFCQDLAVCGLTPELSRTDLRRCASENYQNWHDAAKRCRLGRIVMRPGVEAKRGYASDLKPRRVGTRASRHERAGGERPGTCCRSTQAPSQHLPGTLERSAPDHKKLVPLFV